MTSDANSWTPRQALILATVCLLIGILVGYLAHGPVQPALTGHEGHNHGPNEGHDAPVAQTPITPEALQEASKEATLPILEQLKADPKNVKLLVQAAEMYRHHGQFDKAIDFYKRALDVEDSAPVRNQLANVMFHQGDVDGALAQYALVIKKDPKNDIAMFNTGVLMLQKKNDPKGAVEMWQKLLKANPNHPKRAQVEAMIKQAKG